MVSSSCTSAIVIGSVGRYYDEKLNAVIPAEPAHIGKDGKLVGMKTETVTVPAKTYSPTEMTTVSFSAGTPIDTAKAFVWTDLSGLIPLTSPAIK